MYRDIPDALRALIEPVVEDHGLELVDAALIRGRGRCLLRVIVDTPEIDGRVPVDRCARVSRELGTQLDAEDAIPGSYRLEVSSPGLDRVLARDKDFGAAVGRDVRLETRRALGGRRRFRGLITGFEGGVVTLRLEGECIAVPLENVAKAHVVYEFTRADFARQAGP